jgi:spermidine synthase
MRSSDHDGMVVAILGGGDGGVLHEVLSHDKDFKKVYLVDIDEQVVTASKKHLKSIHRNAFRHPKAKIVAEDASKWLNAAREDFDIVIYDLTTHPESLTSQDRFHFLDDIFYKLSMRMSENGSLSMQCCSEYDRETKDLIEMILRRYFRSIKFKSHFIPSFCEPWLFATAIVK